jgi:hypothetical protein
MRQFLRTGILVATMVGLASCGGTTHADTEGKAEAETVTSTKMTGEAMAELVKSFDPEAMARGNVISFKLQEREVLIVFDEDGGRMRALTPIAPAGLLNEAILLRIAQANYDSVLDVRYAVADELVWSVFIHPLESLQQDELISGIAQLVTAAETFGTSYTSGAMVFGGGDSSEIHNDLIKQLEEAAKKKDAI